MEREEVMVKKIKVSDYDSFIVGTIKQFGQLNADVISTLIFGRCYYESELAETKETLNRLVGERKLKLVQRAGEATMYSVVND